MEIAGAQQVLQDCVVAQPAPPGRKESQRRRRRRAPSLDVKRDAGAAPAAAVPSAAALPLHAQWGSSCESDPTTAFLGCRDVADESEEAGTGPHHKRSRRLSAHQVQVLEESFSADSPKLETSTKLKLASCLDMTPRQVAIWFQNRRARCKTKQLESDLAQLRAKMQALRADYAVALRERDQVLTKVKELTGENLSAMRDPPSSATPSEVDPPTSRPQSVMQDHGEAAVRLATISSADADANSNRPSGSSSSTSKLLDLQSELPCLSSSSPFTDAAAASPVVSDMSVDHFIQCHSRILGPTNDVDARALPAADGLTAASFHLSASSYERGVGVQDRMSLSSSLASHSCGSIVSRALQSESHPSPWQQFDLAACATFLLGEDDVQPAPSGNSCAMDSSLATANALPTTSTAAGHHFPLFQSAMPLVDRDPSSTVGHYDATTVPSLPHPSVGGNGSQGQVPKSWWDLIDDILL